MTSVLDNTNAQTDWFEEICQQLDSLRIESKEFASDEDVLPPDSAFESAKEFFRKLRELSSFPVVELSYVPKIMAEVTT